MDRSVFASDVDDSLGKNEFDKGYCHGVFGANRHFA